MARVAVPLALAIACSMTTSARAATQDDFLVRNTRDIVDLCTTSENDPLYTAAVNFCHGYLLGAFQYHTAMTQAGGVRKICLPNPQPSRNEAIRNFIAWASNDPRVLDERAVDAVARFIDMKWSCPSR
jgi:hypothetical protein